MRKYLLGLLLTAGLVELISIIKNEKTDAQQLIEVEHAFSKMCMEKGQKESFLYFMDDSGVLLRNNQYPLKGKAAKDFFAHSGIGPNVLSWEPTEAVIAKSGDLGYTYGTYLFRLSDTTVAGCYTTFWKKNAKGEWRFVLDTGTSGLPK